MAAETDAATASAFLSTIISSTTAAAFAIATAPPFDSQGPPPPGSMGDHHKPPPPDAPNGECKLLGPFALLVQGALGLLALSALVFKRWRERPQRPLKIWAFDVSKQVVGSVLVHAANLVMSMLSSGQFDMKSKAAEIVGVLPVDEGGLVGRAAGLVVRGLLSGRDENESGVYQPNPCSFYLLNLAIDTTIGIPILIVLLRVFTALFSFTPMGNPPDSLRSGNYGSPPRYSWWFKQCIIYFMGLMGMKFVVLLIFLILPWISRIGDWALRWTEGNEELQVFFVMLFFPLIMNATQYYIIDTFIKNQKPDLDEHGEHARLAQDDSEFGVDESHDSSLEDSEAEDGEEAVKGRHQAPVEVKAKPVKKHLPTGDRHTYDEAYDGESTSTVVGSSSSTRNKLLAEEEPKSRPGS